MEAAHLVGGEISYECIGNNTYQITLKVYRDCNSSGAQFDANASIGIFNGATNVLYTTVSPPHGSVIYIPPTVNNPCLQTPPNVCTQLAVYQATVNLPPTNGGYVITYQRCCRNQTITNIPNPQSWGSTYTVRVPSNDVACNSSPHFTSDPPIVLCNSDFLNISSAATDTDGDSLHYEFCSPLHGGEAGNPQPSPPNAPPYTVVPFTSIYSAANPMAAQPPLQINPQTGIITGTPNTIGQYVVAICVSEYRNGVHLSTVRRDYQFNVTNCQSNVNAAMIVDELNCNGKTITFTDNSFNGSKYFWDFGDTTILTDTSDFINPVYTYFDTGTYKVTLIVNKGWPCADTVEKTIRVYLPANASFTYSGTYCVDGSFVGFTPTSQNTSFDKFSWNFGSNASPQKSTNKFPGIVNFTGAGKHVVSLEVNSFGCKKMVYDTVTVYPNPTIAFNLPKNIGCAPFEVNFKDSSTAATPLYYNWNFGDGNTSTDKNPVHVYNHPGVYNVSLEIYTDKGCLDTLYIEKNNLVTVYPTPISDVSVTPTVTNIYASQVEVIDLKAQPDETFLTDMGNGVRFYNRPKFFYQYPDTGTYDLMHIVTNGFGCADTTIVPVKINPVPLIFAPTAFSPNGDGKNDIYKPAVVGALEYEFIVFSRWGDVVFSTTNPNEGWNGTFQNTGPDLPLGVYTFSIFVRDINYEIASENGTITLIR